MPNYYAWTEIRTGSKVVARGAQVTQSGLGITKEDFEQLVQAGVVRSAKFPAPKDYEGSVVEFLRRANTDTTEDSDDNLSLADVLKSEPSES